VKGFAVLIGVAVLSWLVLGLPAMLLGGAGPEITGTALLICLAPNLLALAVAELVRNRSEYTRTAVLLVSFLARLFVVVGLGFVAYFLLPHLRGHELSLLVWGAMFYLILLAAETRLVSRRLAGTTAGR
jgi:hypothetical protein